MPLVSISDAQREPMPWANWRATVYHGLPDDLYRFHPEPGAYLAFLGRICPEKRVDRAIAIAKRAGIELKIAAKVDPADEEYFETDLADEVDQRIGGAAALLMPIGWPERPRQTGASLSMPPRQRAEGFRGDPIACIPAESHGTIPPAPCSPPGNPPSGLRRCCCHVQHFLHHWRDRRGSGHLVFGRPRLTLGHH